MTDGLIMDRDRRRDRDRDHGNTIPPRLHKPGVRQHPHRQRTFSLAAAAAMVSCVCRGFRAGSSPSCAAAAVMADLIRPVLVTVLPKYCMAQIVLSSLLLP